MVEAGGERQPGGGSVEGAARDAQRRRRIAQEHDRGAVGGVENQAARRGQLGRDDGDDRLELRAQARLLARRAAGELCNLQENDAPHDRRRHAPKDAVFGTP